MNELLALLSVIIISLISVIFAIPFFLKKNISKKVLVFLMSMSVGVLLSTVFMNFLPEIYSHHEGEESVSLLVSIFILIGFIFMFILEKLIHYHHSKKCENNNIGHSHAYNVAPVNLIGDGVHNFIDGLVIAGSYAISAGVGIAATISIIFHEIPQEIADFGVLLYSGFSKKKALLFNLLSAVTAIFGTLVGFLLIGKLGHFNDFLIPFAAGNFLYIAASNLVPQLHRHCGLKDTFDHILAIVLGIILVLLLTLYGPVHVH